MLFAPYERFQILLNKKVKLRSFMFGNWVAAVYSLWKFYPKLGCRDNKYLLENINTQVKAEAYVCKNG